VRREEAKTVRGVRSAEIAPRVGCGIAWVAGVKTAAPPPPDDLRGHQATIRLWRSCT
jgi:hypothetical protein